MVLGFIIASTVRHLVFPVVSLNQIDIVLNSVMVTGVIVTAVAPVAARFWLRNISIGGLVFNATSPLLLGEAQELLGVN